MLDFLKTMYHLDNAIAQLKTALRNVRETAQEVNEDIKMLESLEIGNESRYGTFRYTLRQWEVICTNNIIQYQYTKTNDLAESSDSIEKDRITIFWDKQIENQETFRKAICEVLALFNELF